MVRFVIDLAKAEQLGLFGNKQPSKGPMFPRPSAPAAGGGGTKWVQVPGFARKDGTQVKAHLRHVTQAKPGDAHYKPATGDTHESLHFHATFAAEAAKRDGDKGAEEQLRGIAQQAARGGLDRKWAKETLSTLKRSHHIIGKLEEKEAAVGPAPKAKKPTKPKEPAQPSEPKTPPVDPTMWKVTTKFGPAGGPRVHALTDAGYDAAYRRATRLAPKTREALERMRSKPMPIETIDGSTIRAVNKPHYESARQLVTAGFARFVASIPSAPPRRTMLAR